MTEGIYEFPTPAKPEDKDTTETGLIDQYI